MLKNSEGKKVPNVKFRLVQNTGIEEVTTADLFSGKKVVVFSLPGAFTPTCSSSHVPRYNELVPAFKANGVDDVLCLSVNDSFVMDAWKKDQHAESIKFIPDGNGEFSEQLGLLVDKSQLGFGKRSWRYSMLVNDGVIEKMFIEPEKEGDPFEVSDADTMLNYINPKAKLPTAITLFTRQGCGFCKRSKDLLNSKGISYDEIQLGRDINYRGFRNVTGGQTFPQVIIDGKNIGGADSLAKWVEQNS